MVVGVDVTVVDRIAGALRRHPRFAQRIYTDSEQRYAAAKPERWASRWAAKEAVKKLYGSMGERIPSYKDIEVVRRRGGAPEMHVRGEPTRYRAVADARRRSRDCGCRQPRWWPAPRAS